MDDIAVIGVIEFGSTARNDSDQYSDKDIFAVVEDVDADALDALRTRVAKEYDTAPASVACYSASSFDQMISHGSLFTWHLRLEGRVLKDPDGILTEAFANLSAYEAFAADLARFQEIYADSQEAFAESKTFDTFEQHVLFVVARNICMLLTARHGQPTFGRRSVIPTARQLYPHLPLSISTEETLAAGHLVYMRNVSIDMNIDRVAEPERALREVGELLAFAKEELR
jgi:hypothetical protein